MEVVFRLQADLSEWMNILCEIERLFSEISMDDVT
jgi:hypothetical protein